jgi:glycosyltransferase involved in cell wall biosynthesis
MSRPLRILTWHVHGNYLYYLTQVPHEFYLVVDQAKSVHHTGRSGSLPWGDNVHEAPASEIAKMEFDVILYQSRDTWDDDRHRLLCESQRRLPCVYIEHDPPQQHPTDTRHWVDDSNALLVHVTGFNELMWNSGSTPTRVIEHGVKLLSEAIYTGQLERGLVVVNNLDQRGRRLGADLYARAAAEVPLTLVGMGADRMGGDGEVVNHALPQFMAGHRFFFNPIRYTSLGLAIIEAMMVGLPIVGMATTELVTVIQNGKSGFLDTRLEPLVQTMKLLLADRSEARRMGEEARRVAVERFNIDRFINDWLDTLKSVAQ